MKFKRSLIIIFPSILLSIIIGNQSVQSDKIIETAIEDFLLDKLFQYKMLVIPEVLSHDSFDAIQLPINMIKRWLEDDHNIEKLIIGLETEVDNRKFEFIKNNKYYQYERFATICPPAWSLFSTRELSEFLFFKEVMDRAPERFSIFGFENSYHYYNKKTDSYLLPSQIDTVEQVEKIPFLDSKAPLIIKYIYSRFFRDYMSYSTIREMVEANPDAHFLIIIGNGHTVKEIYFSETDEKVIQAYNLDTSIYTHSVGYFLKKHYSPLFIQSTTDPAITAKILYKYDPESPDSSRFKFFFTDYYYSIPEDDQTNLEEPPLLGIPSARNFTLLKNRNFQLYPDEEYIAVARKLIYFMTGITPNIVDFTPGQAGPCTFIDPEIEDPVNFDKFREPVKQWYFDSTFIKRLKEDLAGYNHRSLYKGIFRMMGKKDFKTLSDLEAEEFINYLLAALSVIGTEQERLLARKHLAQIWGESGDYYYYYKKYYYKRYW